LETSVTSHRKDGWAAVAKHIGYDVTSVQCQKRWQSQLEPLKQGRRRGGDWTNAEVWSIDCFRRSSTLLFLFPPLQVVRLVELVPKHTTQPYWSERLNAMTKPHVSWQTIGKQLGRIPRDCHQKWAAAKKRRKQLKIIIQCDFKLLMVMVSQRSLF